MEMDAEVFSVAASIYLVAIDRDLLVSRLKHFYLVFLFDCP